MKTAVLALILFAPARAAVENGDVFAHGVGAGETGKRRLGQLVTTVFPVGDAGVGGVAAIGTGSVGGVDVGQAVTTKNFKTDGSLSTICIDRRYKYHGAGLCTGAQKIDDLIDPGEALAHAGGGGGLGDDTNTRDGGWRGWSHGGVLDGVRASHLSDRWL